MNNKQNEKYTEIRNIIHKLTNNLSLDDFKSIIYNLGEVPNFHITINQDGNSSNILNEVCKYEKLDFLKFLLELPDSYKLDINYVGDDFYEETALFKAIDGGNIHIVEELIYDKRININHQNNFKETPLHIACYNQNFDIMKMLINHPNINLNLADCNNLLFDDYFDDYINEKKDKINKLKDLKILISSKRCSRTKSAKKSTK